MKTTIALTASFLAMFIFGSIWNVALFEQTYLKLSPEIVRTPDEFNFGIIFATNAIFTAIIYLVGKYFFNQFSLRSLGIGALIGFISVQPALTNLYAKWNYAFQYLLLDTAYTTLLGAVGMVVFCALYFRSPSSIEVQSAL